MVPKFTHTYCLDQRKISQNYPRIQNSFYLLHERMIDYKYTMEQEFSARLTHSFLKWGLIKFSHRCQR